MRVMFGDDRRAPNPPAVCRLWGAGCGERIRGGGQAGEGHAMSSDTLATMSDGELLTAIRRGNVAPAASRVAPESGYYHRDEVMRDEAKRRGIL